MKRFSLANSLSIIGLALSVLATAAQADDIAPASATLRDARTVTVRYADADLASAEGVETLYQRLDRAALRACSRGGDRGADAFADRRACRAAALDAAVAQVQDARLSQLHRARTVAQGHDALVAAADDAH